MADRSRRVRARRASGTVAALVALATTAACGQPMAVGRPAAPGTSASATLAEANASLPMRHDLPRDYRLVGAARGAGAASVPAPVCEDEVAPPGGSVTGAARSFRLVPTGSRTGGAGPSDDELSVTVYVGAGKMLMAWLRRAVTVDCGPSAGHFTVGSDRANHALTVIGSDRGHGGLAEYVVSFGRIVVVVRDVRSGDRAGRGPAAAGAEAEKYLDLVCGRLLRRRFAMARQQTV